MLKGKRRRAEGQHDTEVRHAKIHAHYHKGEHTATQMSFMHNKRWHVVRLDDESSQQLRDRDVVPRGTKESKEEWF